MFPVFIVKSNAPDFPRLSRRVTVLSLAAFPAISANARETPSLKVLVGHICAISPTGMAMVVNDRAVFVIEPQYSDRPHR